jgi:hypothetical protein
MPMHKIKGTSTMIIGFYDLLQKNIKKLLQFGLSATILNCNANIESHNMNIGESTNLVTVLEYAKGDFFTKNNINIHNKKSCYNCQAALIEKSHYTAINENLYCGTPDMRSCAANVCLVKEYKKCTLIPSFYLFSLKEIEKYPNKIIDYLDELYAYATVSYNNQLNIYKSNHKNVEPNFINLGESIGSLHSLIQKECISFIEKQLNTCLPPQTKYALGQLYTKKIINLSKIKHDTILLKLIVILSCANTNHIKYINKKDKFDWCDLLYDEHKKINTSRINMESEEKKSSKSLSLSDTMLDAYPLDNLIEDLKPILDLLDRCNNLNPYTFVQIALGFKEENGYDNKSLLKFMIHNNYNDLSRLEGKSLQELIDRLRTESDTSLERNNINTRTRKISLLSSRSMKSNSNNAKKNDYTEKPNILASFMRPASREHLHSRQLDPNEHKRTNILKQNYPIEDIATPNAIRYTHTGHNISNHESKKSLLELGTASFTTQTPRINFMYPGSTNFYSPFSTERNENIISIPLSPIEIPTIEKYNHSPIPPIPNLTGEAVKRVGAQGTNQSSVLNNSNPYVTPLKEFIPPLVNYGIDNYKNTISLSSRIEENPPLHIPNLTLNSRDNSGCEFQPLEKGMNKNKNKTETKKEKETEISYPYSNNKKDPIFNENEISLLSVFLGPDYDRKLSSNPTLVGELILLRREISDKTTYHQGFVNLLIKYLESRDSSYMTLSEIEKLNATRSDCLSKSDSLESKIQNVTTLPQTCESSELPKVKKREVGKIRNRKPILDI